MTLIDCMKHLFREDDINPLSPEEMRVYMTLLKVWNSNGRPEWFEYRLIPNVPPNTKPNVVPKSTLMRIRSRLQQRCLIQYVSGNGKVKNPLFKICCETKGETKGETNAGTNSKEKVPPTPPLKDNINNNKETSSDEDVKKDKLSSHTSSDRMDWKSFEETFNRMMPPDIPRIKGIKEDRRRKVKARIEEYSKESVMEVFNKIIESDFLSGRNRKSSDTWKCNFDFIFSKDGFRKILEGNYDNGAHQTIHSEKRSVNAQALADFLAEREQRANGMVIEVERPF